MPEESRCIYGAASRWAAWTARRAHTEPRDTDDGREEVRGLVAHNPIDRQGVGVTDAKQLLVRHNKDGNADAVVGESSNILVICNGKTASCALISDCNLNRILKDFHVDDSEVTLNVCIGGDFTGGAMYFHGTRCVDHLNSDINDEDDALAVRCTADGVYFAEAEADCSLEDVRYLERPLMLPKEDLVPYPDDDRWGVEPHNTIMMMQLWSVLGKAEARENMKRRCQDVRARNWHMEEANRSVIPSTGVG